MRSGRPADPNALRRDRVPIDWLILPASGRTDPPPAWPLIKATRRELELWTGLWARPQGVAWETNRSELEVALYVRTFAEAERPGASVSRRTLLQRQAGDLGLTPTGLRANRWIIEASAPATTVREPSRRESARSRLQLVDPAS